MPASPPNFSPFPFAQLPRLTRSQAVIESALARHAQGRRGGWRLAKLVGPVKIVGTSIATRGFDPNAALVEIRWGATSIAVAASGAIRAIAQRVLGGADEVAAPRPATLAEHAVLAMLVAAALEDAGIPGQVWPLSEHAKTIHERELEAVARRARLTIDHRERFGRGGIQGDVAGEIVVPGELRVPTVASGRRAQTPADTIEQAATVAAPPVAVAVAAAPTLGAELIGLELALDIAGAPLAVVCWIPAELVLKAPPTRTHDWRFAVPIVVARCSLPREAVAALRPRDVVVVEPALALVVGDGGFGLTATPGALEARVATGYGRAVATPDEPGLPMTVQLGSVRLSLRKLGELAVGEVIGLDRPLAGPYEIHVAGQLIGHGELVDLDGETGVRIVSLNQK